MREMCREYRPRLKVDSVSFGDERTRGVRCEVWDLDEQLTQSRPAPGFPEEIPIHSFRRLKMTRLETHFHSM